MDERNNEKEVIGTPEGDAVSEVIEDTAADSAAMVDAVAEPSADGEATVAGLKRQRRVKLDRDGFVDYGTGIKGFWKRFFGERKYLLICFILPAMLMWLIHITLEVYPFGTNSVLVLDLNAQYVYYFQALRDIITEGGSLLYSFRRSLGGEFLGIIGYYVASPFSVIMALFPETMITEALLVMFLLKTGLCGLTFGIYIESTRKRNRPLTVLFSTMYALCAYAVVMQHNTMWIDNLIWLPLILLGVENLMKKGKYKMFVITLALAIMSNFYIGYMTCIFVALYFFYCYYSMDPEERNPLGVKFHLPRKVLQIGIFAIIAVLISAVYIWSSYQALTFGKTEFTNPSFKFTQRFDFLDLLSKMYFGSYDTVRPEGWPFLYTGMLTVILMPLFFFIKKIKVREKLATLILCLVMVFSFNTNTIDIIWHGMQKPNWLNYRYAFMLCFVLLVMAYKAFENIREIGYRGVLISGGVATALLFVMQKLEYENLPDLVAVWASLGFIILYVLMLRAATSPTKATRKTAVLVLAIAVSFEMYAGGLANLVALDKDVVISERTGFRDHMDKLSPAVDLVKEKDPGFYRMEKLTHRKTNDNMALGIYGVSNSTSTLNAKVIDLLADFGLASKSHWSKYMGGTPVFDSLFGIKYLIAANNEDASDLYEYRYGTNDTKVSIYENPYAMSIASGVNEALANLNLQSAKSPYHSPFQRMNATVGAMLGDETSVELFKMIPANSIDYAGCTQSSLVSEYKFTRLDNEQAATVTIKFTTPNDELVYMYIPTESAQECQLSVNGLSKGTYYGNETFRIVEIGTFEEGEEVTVVLNMQKKYLQIANNVEYFATLDLDACREILPKLQTSSFNIDYHTEDTLRGTIHILPGQELVYTSIPYDEGWKIIANGQEIEMIEILGGLMAFRLDAGSYNLELKYRPDCAVYGIMISAGGVVLFAAVWVCEWIIKKRRAKKAVAVGAPIDSELGIAELDLGVPEAVGSEETDCAVETEAENAESSEDCEAEE